MALDKPIHFFPRYIVDRFWAKVEIKSEEECWLWKAPLGTTGYAQFFYSKKKEVAHRFSYRITRGSPKDLLVLHSCDNRSCVNPKHLFLGTAKDNTQDAVRKGRLSDNKGENNYNNKLTEDAAQEIKKKLDAGIFQRDIALEYNVSRQAITEINIGRNWGWVG